MELVQADVLLGQFLRGLLIMRLMQIHVLAVGLVQVHVLLEQSLRVNLRNAGYAVIAYRFISMSEGGCREEFPAFAYSIKTRIITEKGGKSEK